MISAEDYAFADRYNYDLSFKMLVQDMLSTEIKQFIFTDRKSFFDMITKYRRIKKLQRMYEIADIRRAYEYSEIINFSRISIDFSIADRLTRSSKNKILHDVLATDYIQHPIEEWTYKS
eukprot:IDg16006t1